MSSSTSSNRSSTGSVEMWKSKLGTNYPKDFMKANEKKFHQQLQDLRHEPANRDCADCGAKGCTMWASVNLGVFLCMTCGSHHRSIGTHISKPKGCTGTYWWGPDELDNMRAIGNARASQIYGNGSSTPIPPPGLTPDNGAHTMEWRKYITDKYTSDVNRKHHTAGPATSSHSLSSSPAATLQDSLDSRAQTTDESLIPSLLVKEEDEDADLITFEEGKEMSHLDFFANFGESPYSAATTTSTKSNTPLPSSPPPRSQTKKDVDLLGLNNNNIAIMETNKGAQMNKGRGFDTVGALANDNFFAEFGL
eukprot:CAMPEP_0113638084 /NCGR_PEP_ID=MMETSP0017_2-20120614/19944_1 /TAXON_ID=2856 /ORGANISM="Cylindrotheca closterium" /LENGTH=306 /DNA_ID=CAMNT_0000549161 /DNA_START=980 /DNA_END=1900 /DNA_ORIENTATION=+ /assembly_acc=CAM_ASM_000147